MNGQKPKSLRIYVAVVLVGVLALAGLLSARLLWNDDDQEKFLNAAAFTVMRGPLTISVSESGMIRSRQQIIIKSEVEGTSTILYIVPEGTQVKQGDLLVELDASRMQDLLISQEITVQNAEAAHVRARENLGVVRSQAESDIAQAELNYRFAQEDLKKYLEGDYPNQLKEAESRITLAKEELGRAQDKRDWSQILFNEKYLSKTELQADELALEKARLNLELAESAKRLLEEYTHRRRLDELNSGVEQARRALERVRLKANADIVQAEAEYKARAAELARQQLLLKKTTEQLAKAKIYAPTSGLVIYATTASDRFRGNNEPLTEGSTVRERQDLIYLPTTDSVMAVVKVHESSLDKIRPGLRARVTVDALPGRVFTGVVDRISPMPDAQSMWSNPDLKVYNTDIHLDGDGSGLRTGMTCRAEIIVAEYADAVYVPVHTIVRVGNQPTVYLPGPRGPIPRAIELGLDNNSMAHVISGLSPGERVLLAPPLAESALSVLEQQPAAAPPADTPAAQGAAVPTPAPPPVDATAGVRRGQRAGQRGTMTDEQRQRLQEMTPEERQRAIEQLGGRRGGRGPNGGPPQP
jgi:HlyD family secretion protein